jgi:hypothetical protein
VDEGLIGVLDRGVQVGDDDALGALLDGQRQFAQGGVGRFGARAGGHGFVHQGQCIVPSLALGVQGDGLAVQQGHFGLLALLRGSIEPLAYLGDFDDARGRGMGAGGLGQ